MNKEELKELAPQLLIILCLGIMVGLTWSTMDSYKTLCIVHCNETYGPLAQASMGFAASSCTCTVLNDPGFAVQNSKIFPNLSGLFK